MDSIEDFDQCRDGSFAPINRFAVVTCLARRQSWMHAPYVQISMCPPEDPGFGVLGFWGLGWLRFSLRDDLAISSQTGGFRFRCYLMVIRPPSAIVASICQVVNFWHHVASHQCKALLRRWPKAASGIGPSCLCESSRAHRSLQLVSMWRWSWCQGHLHFGRFNLSVLVTSGHCSQCIVSCVDGSRMCCPPLTVGNWV